MISDNVFDKKLIQKTSDYNFVQARSVKTLSKDLFEFFSFHFCEGNDKIAK
jgi:hypothetical protein